MKDRDPRRMFALLLCLLGILVSGGCRCESRRAEAEALVARWMLAYNSHDLPSFTAMYAEKGLYRVPLMILNATNSRQLRGMLENMWRRFVDLRIVSTDDIVAAGNQIAFRWEIAFTRWGGRPVRVMGATIMTFDGDRIVKEWTVFVHRDRPRG